MLRKKAYQNNYLQKLTLNEETAFSDETVEQLLQEIQDEIKRPLQEEILDKTKRINDLIEQNNETKIKLKKALSEQSNLQKENDRELSIKEELAGRIVKRMVDAYFPLILAISAVLLIVFEYRGTDGFWLWVVRFLMAVLGLCFYVIKGFMSEKFKKLVQKFVNAYCAYKNG